MAHGWIRAPWRLPADMTAGESSGARAPADETFASDPHVIDRDQRLLGYVELAELLRAPAADFARAPGAAEPASIAGAGTAGGMREHPGWREASALPVVERGDRLVGALTHAALLRALATQAGDADAAAR